MREEDPACFPRGVAEWVEGCGYGGEVFGYHFGVRGGLVEAGGVGGERDGVEGGRGDGWAGVSAAGFFGMIAGFGEV